MMSRTKVAFIIVCWNNEDLLRECVESIGKQTYKDIVTYIVDNGSDDNSVSTARKLMPSAIVIEAGENLGFAKGNNVGITMALKDAEVGYIALLNTDARLESDWTEKLVKFSSNKPRAACLQGLTLDYYNHDIIDSTHIYVARNGQATQGSWRDYHERDFEFKKVFGVNAAACIITRDFIETQPFGEELFDESMFMYLEDVDLAVRATVMGWDNYHVSSTRAYHMGSASSSKNPGFSLYLTFRNNSGMIIKNFPLATIVRLIPKIIVSDLETFRHLRKQGKNSISWIIPKARIIGIFQAPIYWLKRRKMMKVSTIDKDFLWTLMKKGY